MKKFIAPITLMVLSVLVPAIGIATINRIPDTKGGNGDWKVVFATVAIFGLTIGGQMTYNRLHETKTEPKKS